MARTTESPVARLEGGTGGGALEDLRVDERVAALDANAGCERDIAGQLGPPGTGQADVEVLRVEGCEIGGEGDDVAIAVVEPGHVEPDAIAGQPLLDAKIEGAAAFGLEAGIAEEERVGAERLQDGRFLDALAGAAVHAGRAYRSIRGARVPR